jgi:hypothetical protein
MSYVVSLNTLSTEQRLFIRSMLFFQPEKPFRKTNKFQKAPATTPILFFNIVDDLIYLPYFFAAAMFKICPNVDLKYPSTTLTFTAALRDYQKPVIEQAVTQLNTYGTTTLALYPGFGKTILGVYLAAEKKLVTCILVTRKILITQWLKTINDNLVIIKLDKDNKPYYTKPDVWIVGENSPSTCDIIICMDTRTHLLTQQFRSLIGFLIIDEAHMFCTPGNVTALLGFTPKFIVVETATLERDDGMHIMIHAVAGKHAITRETTKPFTVLKLNTNTVPTRVYNYAGDTNYTELVKSTLFDERRNKIIMDIILANTNKTILILTSLVNHVELLYQKLMELKVECDFMSGNKKKYKDSNVLIGTTSKIGTGFDSATAAVDYRGKPFDLLLLVCSIKKYSMLVQNVGRSFRSESPYVIHFVDNDEIFKSHWRKAEKWYRSRNGVVLEHTCHIIS